MSIIDSISDALRFKDTIFYKKNSDLHIKQIALNRLLEEFPNNKDLISELNIVNKGIEGEDEITYQLSKANIGMYVLRDIKLKYEDLTAQIDYVVITPVFTYYIECKNLVGNIKVNEKGDFIREFSYNGEKIKKGIYSPLRQVEAQREVARKIWEHNTSTLKKLFASKNFDYYRRVLVVAANRDTILDTDKAPKDIKYKVLRSDNLVRQIQYDLNHRDGNDYVYSQKEMQAIAESYANLSDKEIPNYYSYFRNKCISDLKEKLLKFRKKRAYKLNMPEPYIFNDKELNSIINKCPRKIEDLNGILPEIKIKTHGKAIIAEING